MCKKLVFILMVLAVAGLTVPASAADPNYYLPGDWNAWNVVGDQMTNDGGGMYSRTMTELTPDTRYLFKVSDGTWDWLRPGENCWVYSDSEGEVDIGFNTNVVSDGWLTDQYRIGVSTDLGTWTLAGSFGWSDNPEMPGGAGYADWDNSAATGITMAAQGGGIYMVSLHLPVGGGPSWAGNDNGTPGFDTYGWKTANSDSWDSISENERSINTANAFVVVSAGMEDWDFYVDAYTGVVKAVPEPATIALLGLGGLALIRRKR